MRAINAKDVLSNKVKFDEYGNYTEIVKVLKSGYKYCREFNGEENEISFSDNRGFKSWTLYDNETKVMFRYNNRGYACAHKYDMNGKPTGFMDNKGRAITR